MIQFMVATGWRNFLKLSYYQYASIILGMPSVAIGNLNRLLKYPIRKSWSSVRGAKANSFVPSKEGFNEFGDEESHWYLSWSKNVGGRKATQSGYIGDIDKSFIKWLSSAIEKCEMGGKNYHDSARKY